MSAGALFFPVMNEHDIAQIVYQNESALQDALGRGLDLARNLHATDGGTMMVKAHVTDIKHDSGEYQVQVVILKNKPAGWINPGEVIGSRKK